MGSQVVGEKIKKRRKDLNLTQKELAEISGVSYSTLRKMETNVVSSPRIENLTRITKSLQLEIDSLLVPSLHISKELQRFSKNIAKEFNMSDLKSIRESQIKLVESLTQNKDVVSMTLNSYEATVKELSRMNFDWLIPIKEMIANMGKSMDKWYEIFQNFEQQNKRNTELMSSAGWFLSPSLMDISMVDINKALDKIAKGDEKAIFLLSKKYFREDNFKNLDISVQEWQKNCYFKKRKKLITEAINNHKSGAYASAITLLLTQLEGIAGEVCEDNPKIKVRKDESKSKDKIVESFKKNNLEKSILYSDSVLLAIDGYIFASTRSLQRKVVFNSSFQGMLNRNGILHGNILKFGTEENSYKCILLLDILCYLTMEKDAKG